MSGFALVFDQQGLLNPDASVCTEFLDSAAEHKCLDEPGHLAARSHCVAAKFDTPSSLHRGIAQDEATGSWLLAAGTVIDEAAVMPDGNLHQLLADYLERGVGVFERLDGQFAVVIFDGRDDSALVISDPFGFISVFYGQKGNRLFVSTSALAVAQAVYSKPSEFGVHYFILYGSVFGETTLWEDVKRVLPANVLRLTRGGIEHHTYWGLSFDQKVAALSLDESVDAVVDVLSQKMRGGLAREGEAWLSLTGGFDTRMLAGMMEFCGLPFETYCHGQPDSRDVRIASLISQKMGWDHEYFALPEDWGHQRSRWLSQTLGHSDGHLGVLKMSRIIREQSLKAQGHNVSLWGFGGEVYRGYFWKQEFFNVGTTSKVDYDRLLDYRLLPSVGWPILKDASFWTKSVREMLKAQLQAIGEQHADWPNTVKLDLIGKYLDHSWTGAHISAVMGLQRAISVLDFKDSVARVFSVNPKWRAHSRLFRFMLERVNPELASIETADGGPASPLRPTNLHQFFPYWSGLGQKVIWGASRKVFGRNPWGKKDSGPDGTAYPLAQWREDTLSQLETEDLLVPTRMHSADLYDLDTLEPFLAQARTNDFKHDGLLSRVITVEMAMRSTGVSV